MKPIDFGYEFKKLAEAFREPEPTRERLDALFEAYGHIEAAAVRAGMRVLMLGNRYPSAAEIARAFAEAEAAKAAPDRYPVKPHGGFRSDGSWDKQADGLDQRTAFVKHLIRQVRDETCTPAEVFDIVTASDYRAMFHPTSMAVWSEERRYNFWPMMPCATAAESTVKYQSKQDRAPWNLPDWADKVGRADQRNLWGNRSLGLPPAPAPQSAEVTADERERGGRGREGEAP